LSGKDLKQLYEKANELSLANDVNLIIKAGMNSTERLYFQMERYRLLVNEGLSHDNEAVSLREQLLKEDPQNHNLTHYQLAVIDFEACCEQKENEESVKPLLNYMQKFGDQDKTNLWRLQMIVSQVYFDQNNLAEALKYAQYSHDSAPSS